MHEQLSQSMGITCAELQPAVSLYLDNLLAQRDVILERYGLAPETAEKFCDLSTAHEDRETMFALYEKLVYVIENKQIPSLEFLEEERMREQHRINEFFGEDKNIEVPPLPKTITAERIEQWRKKHFELRYLPPITLYEDDEYPGWKHKPTQVIDILSYWRDIYLCSANKKNKNLDMVTPHELSGNWVLVDTRPKPRYARWSCNAYDDDHDLEIILAGNQFLQGRFNLHPDEFDKDNFWDPIKKYLGITDKDEAIVRLPRVIEQNVLNQDNAWYEGNVIEWAEERNYDYTGMRMCSGGSTRDGIKWRTTRYAGAHHEIGFRFVVVFY